MKAAEGRTVDGLTGQLVEARAFLWKAASRLAPDRWSESASPAYSPVGWHLGHVAVTQARWLLPGEAVAERFGGFFDPVQTAKVARGELPPPEELRALLAQVLDRARERLKTGPLPTLPPLPPEFLVRHVAQHELQHAEHIQVIAALFDLLFLAVNELPATVPVALALVVIEAYGRVSAGRRRSRPAASIPQPET